MKRIIDVEKDYYEIIRYNVEHGQEYKPFEIIANSIPAANLEYRSFMEGYMAGCEEAKKCYERPQSFWVKEENESYCFDSQTGDVVVRVRYHCFKCGGSGDNKDKFCKHCGAEMKGSME